MKKINTHQLSTMHSLNPDIVIANLIDQGLIYHNSHGWHLTILGIEHGGEIIPCKKYKTKIVWPLKFDPFNLHLNTRKRILSTTRIGKLFNIPAIHVNKILHKIKWIHKASKGWHISKDGADLGGQEIVTHRFRHYVLWPARIAFNKTLKEAFKEYERSLTPMKKEIIVDSTESIFEGYYFVGD